MIRDVINELKKYTAGKKNTQKTEISVLVLNRLIFALEEQEPKTGHWIKDDITERSKSAYKHKCDRCGAYHRAMYDYCPSCGAKMIEPQERSEVTG